MDFLKRSWATINLDYLESNARQIKQMVSSSCKIMAVVKADAYGHGDKYVSELFECMDEIDWFGVSNINEALRLRNNNINKPILVFGTTPVEYAKTLSEFNITQTVFSLEYATSLNQAAVKNDVIISSHIKIDSGMSRLGFNWGSTDEIIDTVSLSHIEFTGIFTHFSVADEINRESVEFTNKQFDSFMSVCEILSKQGIEFSLKHCCNSGATLLYPHMYLDMIRPGIILYGLNPSHDTVSHLSPVMELFSTVSMVKEIYPGDTVGYGRNFTANSIKKIATIAIGYADGYERVLSNKACMMINGKFAKVVGNVCMDQLMLDVSYIDNVHAGDIVTIVGTSGDKSLSFDDMANISGTISYEKICLIGKRIPRVYLKNGDIIGVMDYIV